MSKWEGIMYSVLFVCVAAVLIANFWRQDRIEQRNCAESLEVVRDE